MQVFVEQVNIAFIKESGFLKWHWPIVRFWLCLFCLTWPDWTGLLGFSCFSIAFKYHSMWVESSEHCDPEVPWCHILRYRVCITFWFSSVIFSWNILNDLLIAGQSVVLPFSATRMTKALVYLSCFSSTAEDKNTLCLFFLAGPLWLQAEKLRN